jgi:hypothetical protein
LRGFKPLEARPQKGLRVMVSFCCCSFDSLHEVNGPIPLTHTPTMMTCVDTGPKQLGQSVMDRNCQNKHFLFLS